MPIGSSAQYTQRFPVFFNGTALEEVSDITVTLDTGQTEVFTVTKGLAGFCAGAMKVTAHVSGAIPIGGPEIDFWNIAMRMENCTLQVGVGQADFMSTGRIMNVSFSGGTSNPASVEFDWTGPPGFFE